MPEPTEEELVARLPEPDPPEGVTPGTDPVAALQDVVDLIEGSADGDR
jgi:hypothetical protein